MSFEKDNLEITQSDYDENTSGKGSGYSVPDAVKKKFNWGAFCGTWIWGLGNYTFITLWILPLQLLTFIPVIGWLICLCFSIWFGIKGNEWAWQEKHFESVDAFHSYQRKWAIAGVILFCMGLIITILFTMAMTIPIIMNAKTR